MILLSGESIMIHRAGKVYKISMGQIGWTLFALCTVALIAILSGSAHAATYYVDPAGNDGNDGLSSNNLAHGRQSERHSASNRAIRSCSLYGDEWHEQLAAEL